MLRPTRMLFRPIIRSFSESGQQKKPKAEDKFAQVTGLSSAVVKKAEGKLGPGASKDGDYKNLEYFCYDAFSYHHAEVEMAKYRLPQPSAVK